VIRWALLPVIGIIVRSLPGRFPMPICTLVEPTVAVAADIETSDGVIHVIDTVMFPN